MSNEYNSITICNGCNKIFSIPELKDHLIDRCPKCGMSDIWGIGNY